MVTVKTKNCLDRNDIIATIISLAQSQGLYARLLRDLRNLKENDPVEYECCMCDLEARRFTSALDFILWYET